MTKLRFFLSTSLLLLVWAAPLYAWNNSGHMVIAYVAYQYLNPQARARVDELIRLNPQFKTWDEQIPPETSASQRRVMLFMYAATWADQIKGDPDYQKEQTGESVQRIIGYKDHSMHRDWHFIDVPFSADNSPLAQPQEPNLLTQLPKLRAALSSNGSDDLKSFALVWFIHLIGDAHQPMHCVTRFSKNQPRGDQGGNAVILCDPQCGKRLHSYWDSLLGASTNPVAAIAIARTVLSLQFPGETTKRSNSQNDINLNPTVWVDESFMVAKNVAYTSPVDPGMGPFTLSAVYRGNAHNAAMSRASLAAARLAKILNAELK